MFKKVFIFGFILLLLGCTTPTKVDYENFDSEEVQTLSSEFNEEIYIWECIYFSTNRTNQVK